MKNINTKKFDNGSLFYTNVCSPGEKVIVSKYSEEVSPLEVYILPNGAKNEEPSLVFVGITRRLKAFHFQITLDTLKPLINHLKEMGKI